MEVEKNTESEANVSGTRSFPFEIDLNETPSSSPPETLAGDEPVSAPEGGSRGGFSGSLCGSCGTAADVDADMVVCSSCWKKFHLRCFGTKEDQKCLKCLFSTGGSKRKTGFGLLDMNASPPREADGEGFLADSQSSGHGLQLPDADRNVDKMHHVISRSLNVPMQTSNMVYIENGYDLLRASVGIRQSPKTGYGIQQPGFNRIPNDADLVSPYRGGVWPTYSSPLNFRSPIKSGVLHYLQTEERTEGIVYPSKGVNSNRRRKQPLKLAKLAQCNDNHKIPSNHIAGVEMMFQAMLPLQYGELFVLSWGNIDPRPSYHNATQIWPVGYRSCWHDKITGSVFVSEVVDGGDIGPCFQVRRYPCSTHPIPMGSTVLWRKQPDSKHLPGRVADDGKPTFETQDDEESLSIQLMLTENNPPHLESIDFGKAKSLTTGSSSQLQRSVCAIPDDLPPGDCIDYFRVQASSSKIAWKAVSENLMHSCTETYKRRGVLRFCCKHSADEMNAKPTHDIDSLSKFCFLYGPTDIPHLIRTTNEFETYSEMLMQWLRQDRFGLDLEFVQEILEQHPGAQSCSEYKRLNERSQSGLQTVGSGFLLAKHGNVQAENRTECPQKQPVEEYIRKPLPLGEPVSAKLPAYLIGEVLQAWEFLWRFHEVLGIDKPFTFQELESELMNPWVDSTYPLDGRGNENLYLADVTTCTGTALQKIHRSLLNILVGELLRKVATEPNSEVGEVKPRRGRKKGSDVSLNSKDIKLDMLQINGLTWPELARRYVLVVLSMDGNLESADLISRERHKIFPCLQGDGGTLCGSLSGVEGMEGDALLLAEASKRVFGLAKSQDFVSIIHGEADATGAPKTIDPDSSDVPEWAQALEPVRKLPTNVGARIRKCVYEALEKNPPDWAKKIMEHSISKEVYKGNASGPTKRAIVNLLAEVSQCDVQPKPCKKEKEKVKTVSTSDVIMQKCRSVLRHTAAADEEKVFCNLLGRTHNSKYNDDEGRLGYPAMVSRPLDFRTVDARLSVGVYGGSHEAFLEDVREVLNNIRTAYADQPDLIDLVESLSQKFEAMYESEVLSVVQKLGADFVSLCTSDEAKKEIDDLLAQASESSLPKAPWDDGVCKICGVDKDDDNVLLCDTCDSEYHTYCLNPPLPRIPEGNWYCPSCVAGQFKSQGACNGTRVSWSRKKRYQGELSRNFMESLIQLARNLGSKEYWEFSVAERIFLLKFLCDETLNTSIVRKHLEQCSPPSFDLHQKLRFLYSEWKNLRFKEEAMFAKLERANVVYHRVGESGSDRLASIVAGGSSQSEDCNKRTWDFSNNLPGRSLAGHLHYQQSARDQSQAQESHIPYKHLSAELNNWQDEMSIATLKQKIVAREESSKSPQSAKQCVKDSEAGDSLVMSCPISEGLISPDANNKTPLHPNSEHKSDGHSSSQPDANVMQEGNQEFTSLKHEISVLQDSIARVESELEKVYLRKDILGRDAAGRVYWAFDRPDICSLLVLDGTQLGELSEFGGPSQNNANVGVTYGQKNSGRTCKWTSYQSDSEIEELIGTLRNGNEKERELAELISRWRRRKPKGSRDVKTHIRSEKQPAFLELSNGRKAENSCFFVSNAMIAMEKKYGTGFESEAICSSNKKRGQKAHSTRERIVYRCKCLEPIWPSKHHCLSCHQTYPSEEELNSHRDGKCIVISPDDRETEDSLRGKKTTNEPLARKRSDDSKTVKSKKNELISSVSTFQEPECPIRYEDIVRNFVTNNSLKDLVREIGLPAGSPSLVPNASPYIGDSALLVNGGTGTADMKNHVEISIDRISILGCMKGDNDAYIFSRCSGNDRDDASGVTKLIFNSTNEKYKTSSKNRSFGQRQGTHCVIPESSLRRLVGRVSEVLRQLKINLLDMDAALPEEALRPSMSKLEKRSAWRAFVKSAASIYEMVQATIVLENMIKADFLRKEWWHWSSLSAAANVSTLSALALRLCTLDAAIIFDKPSSGASGSDDTRETNNGKDESAPMNVDTSSSPVAEKSPPDAPDTSRSRTRSKKRKKNSAE